MGRSRLGWAMALGAAAVAWAPGVAQADAVPGFDLDPVELSARMDECLAFTGPKDAVLIAPMTDLAERYEDRPDDRATIGAEIGAQLDPFRARAPWPITEEE